MEPGNEASVLWSLGMRQLYSAMSCTEDKRHAVQPPNSFWMEIYRCNNVYLYQPTSLPVNSCGLVKTSRCVYIHVLVAMCMNAVGTLH